jgi:hypothetical protein
MQSSNNGFLILLNANDFNIKCRPLFLRSQNTVKFFQSATREYLKKQGHLARMGEDWRDQDVDGRIILRRIFRKLEGVVGTGWSWF